MLSLHLDITIKAAPTKGPNGDLVPSKQPPSKRAIGVTFPIDMQWHTFKVMVQEQIERHTSGQVKLENLSPQFRITKGGIHRDVAWTPVCLDTYQYLHTILAPDERLPLARGTLEFVPPPIDPPVRSPSPETQSQLQSPTKGKGPSWTRDEVLSTPSSHDLVAVQAVNSARQAELIRKRHSACKKCKNDRHRDSNCYNNSKGEHATLTQQQILLWASQVAKGTASIEEVPYTIEIMSKETAAATTVSESPSVSDLGSISAGSISAGSLSAGSPSLQPLQQRSPLQSRLPSNGTPSLPLPSKTLVPRYGPSMSVVGFYTRYQKKFYSNVLKWLLEDEIFFMEELLLEVEGGMAPWANDPDKQKRITTLWNWIAQWQALPPNRALSVEQDRADILQALSRWRMPVPEFLLEGDVAAADQENLDFSQSSYCLADSQLDVSEEAGYS